MRLGHMTCALGIAHVPWAFENERMFDRLSLGAKERGLEADSGRKYEIWDKNMLLPKSERRHGPCHQQHGRAKLQGSHLLLLLRKQATYFDRKPVVSCGTF
ncbi:hypothetical protein MTR_7g498260 [Medicago truncatula]|uniref:Uncharacterized protein n=1 Tax=Medicago truncatula TaxID=3880 RepID=A0A072U2M2_MEDTR|nr:hypothetical protein MTR_7g498260 [Medicago truncatula]